MAELNDYSGPFNPHLTFNDLSKDFLLKAIRIWQWAWIQEGSFWSANARAKVLLLAPKTAMNTEASDTDPSASRIGTVCPAQSTNIFSPGRCGCRMTGSSVSAQRW